MFQRCCAAKARPSAFMYRCDEGKSPTALRSECRREEAPWCDFAFEVAGERVTMHRAVMAAALALHAPHAADRLAPAGAHTSPMPWDGLLACMWHLLEPQLSLPPQHQMPNSCQVVKTTSRAEP